MTINFLIFLFDLKMNDFNFCQNSILIIDQGRRMCPKLTKSIRKRKYMPELKEMAND